MITKATSLSHLRKRFRNGLSYCKVRANGDAVRRAVSLNITNTNKYVLGHWFDSVNFGDAASPLCLELITGKTAINVNNTIDFTSKPVYSVVGSVLGWSRSSKTVVWGSGFLDEKSRFRTIPKRVHAVRGPLTRERCLQQGVECPPIYGDPAVFVFARYKNINTAKDFGLGLIPHYSDASNSDILRIAEEESVKVIDVMRPVGEVVADVARCKHIASSSLHGLILADALSIPSRWLRVSDRVTRGGFKYQDYFLSVGRREEQPLDLEESTTVRHITDQTRVCTRPIDLDALLEVCPFRPDYLNSASQLYR